MAISFTAKSVQDGRHFLVLLKIIFDNDDSSIVKTVIIRIHIFQNLSYFGFSNSQA